jgi:hypothetical protein
MRGAQYRSLWLFFGIMQAISILGFRRFSAHWAVLGFTARLRSDLITFVWGWARFAHRPAAFVARQRLANRIAGRHPSTPSSAALMGGGFPRAPSAPPDALSQTLGVLSLCIITRLGLLLLQCAPGAFKGPRLDEGHARSAVPRGKLRIIQQLPTRRTGLVHWGMGCRSANRSEAFLRDLAAREGSRGLRKKAQSNCASPPGLRYLQDGTTELLPASPKASFGKYLA